jgi:hypothetical protein
LHVLLIEKPLTFSELRIKRTSNNVFGVGGRRRTSSRDVRHQERLVRQQHFEIFAVACLSHAD